MRGKEILIWHDASARNVVMKQGEQEQVFTTEQWAFICRCVDKDLSNRLDDALRLLGILKSKQEARREDLR